VAPEQLADRLAVEGVEQVRRRLHEHESVCKLVRRDESVCKLLRQHGADCTRAARPSRRRRRPTESPYALKCGQGMGGRRTRRAALARGRVRVSDLRSLLPRIVEGVQRQQLVAAVQLAGRRGVSAAVLPARS
jgi:hypothetical protein